MKPVASAVSIPALSLTVLVVCAALAGNVHADEHALIRYTLSSPEDLQWVRTRPDPDIVSIGNGRSYVDIIVGESELASLREAGATFRILPDKYDPWFLPTATLADVPGRTVVEIVAFMDELRTLYPDVVSQKWSLGQSHEGRDIWCFRMSNEPDVDLGRPALLIDALHHPGEWYTVELAVRLAEHFAQSYGSDPEITYLLDRREVYFVPIVNPDGRVYIEENPEVIWNKKNRRDNGDGTFGVNLNDNYPFMWGVSGVAENDSTWSAGYRGPFPGSEPETQAIMGLVNSHDFVTHQSFHGPGKMTFYPWAYTADPTPDAATYAHMAEMMTRLNGYLRQPVSEFAVFSGPTIDWSYGAQDEHEKIFAFTNEVGSDGQGTLEERLQQIRDDNIWPAMYLMRVAGAYVEAREPAVVGGDGDGDLDPGETAGLSFSLVNEGVRKAATGVSVRISSDDPYLQLAEAERTVGSIAATSSVELSAAPFTATLDPDCPVGRTIRLDVTVTQQDGPLHSILRYVVGGPVVLFSDDFESGTDGWTLTGTWGLTSSTSHSPVNALTDSPGGNYANLDSTSATISQAFTASSLALSFWHEYQTEASIDHVMVQVSADGGPWTTLPGMKLSGANGGWEQPELPLDDYLGEPIQIRFQIAVDFDVTDDGWYLDDVVVTGSELTNRTPSPPQLISPAPGATVEGTPVLTVVNGSDPDGPGPLTYGFRVYDDSLCTSLAASVDDLAEGETETAWQVSSLPDGTYWWRAYAADPTERGLLGETRMFVKEAAIVQKEWANLRVNEDQTLELQNEEQIAINPVNPDNMVVVWIDVRLGYPQVAWAYTFDAGATWTEGGLFVEPTFEGQSDPGVTSDEDGNFFAVVLSSNHAYSESGLYVYRSTDGGVSWESPQEVVSQVPGVFEDKEFIACDRTGGSHSGNLYVTWARFVEDPFSTRILLRRSTDRGSAWSEDVAVSDGNGHFPIPVVGSQGEIYVAWSSYDEIDGPNITIDVSTDGGVTFGTDHPVTTVATSNTMLNGGVHVYSSPHMDADITGGPFSGRLYLAFMDQRNGLGDRDIWVTTSDDMGQTWSPPLRINDDPVDNGCDQFHPWLTVDNTGVVTVAFLDRRDDPENLAYHCYLAQSVDGGASWSTNVRVSTEASDPTLASQSDAAGRLGDAIRGAVASPGTLVPSALRAGLLGEYIGVVAWDGVPTPVWTDIRYGNQDVFAGHLEEGVAVLIQRLDATMLGDAVHLQWALSTDERLAGFNLYRREGAEGSERRVNPRGLIPESDRSFDDTDFQPGRDYHYTLAVVRPDGSEVRSAPVEISTTPHGFSQEQNFPNPFNPGTTMAYSIPEAGKVTLRVYDLRGRLVATLVNEYQLAGRHTAAWDARDEGGSAVASGTYLVRLRWSNRVETRKIVLAK